MSWNTLYHFILGMGSLQGIIMALLLWTKNSPRKLNNRFLALILIFFSYRLAVNLLFLTGIASVQNALYHLLLEYNWIYGPLLFFYVLSYLDRSFKFKRIHLIHLLPSILEFVCSNFIKIQNFYWDGSKESLSSAGYWGYVIWEHTPFQYLISLSLVLFYTELSRRQIVQEKKLKKSGADWLKQILLVYRYFSITTLALVLTDYLFFDYAFNAFSVFPTFIGMAVITYWLGIEGFSRRNKVLPLLSTNSVSDKNPIKEQLQLLMTEQALYKSPDLTQSRLAHMLDIPPYQLTQYLNEVEQKNFNDFINSYRVEAFKKALTDPRFQHLSLLGMGMEVGFNSKATFNRAVKKETEKTPGKLRDDLLKNVL